jgi:pyruvate/2-oxoglutarate dehydrogenase complex dihydrolipoamide dehydrogenase (E3) component
VAGPGARRNPWSAAQCGCWLSLRAAPSPEFTLYLGRQCTKVEDSGSELTVHFGDGETVEADLMLVAVGRGPLVEGIGLKEIGVQFDRRFGIATDVERRTSVPHIYAVGDCAG